MNAKTFSLLTCGLTWLAFALIAIANFCVNPRAQYGPTFVEPVLNPTRAAKLALIDQQDPAPGGLILGSSRVMKLEPGYLEAKTGLRFFNAGVYFGKSEDWLAIVRAWRKRFDRMPEMIVLGIDPVGLSDVQPIDGRLLGTPTLVREIPDLVSWRDHAQRYRELLGWSQTKDSAKAVAKQLLRGGEPPKETFDDDGLLIYNEREREIKAGTYDFEASLAFTMNEYEGLYSQTDGLSPKRCEALRMLLDELREANTQVLLFATPMHPELLQHLASVEKYAPFRKAAVGFIRKAANEHGFRFLDFENIDSFSGDPSEFYDGIHPFESNTRRMIGKLLGDLGPCRDGSPLTEPSPLAADQGAAETTVNCAVSEGDVDAIQ